MDKYDALGREDDARSSSADLITITSVKCPSFLFLNPATFSPVQIELLASAFADADTEIATLVKVADNQQDLLQPWPGFPHNRCGCRAPGTHSSSSVRKRGRAAGS